MLQGLKLKISNIFMDNFELGKYLLYVLLGTYTQRMFKINKTLESWHKSTSLWCLYGSKIQYIHPLTHFIHRFLSIPSENIRKPIFSEGIERGHFS